MKKVIFAVLFIMLITTSMSFAFGSKNANKEHHRTNVKQEITRINDAPVPVPEPTTLILMGTGLAGLIGVRYLNRKK